MERADTSAMPAARWYQGFMGGVMLDYNLKRLSAFRQLLVVSTCAPERHRKAGRHLGGTLPEPRALSSLGAKDGGNRVMPLRGLCLR